MRLAGRLLILISLAVAPSMATAQHIGQNASVNQTVPPTISVSSQMVVEPVTAKDKNGKIIRGLTSKDFVVT